MKIGCVYTVEAYNSIEQPLGPATNIPYGISLIATVLNDAGHDVELFVITPDTPLDEYIGKYIEDERPSLFCLTAVSTQYEMTKKVSRYITQTDDTIFCILGGHHSSLNSEKVIREGVFDAICVGEGEKAIVSLADELNKDVEFNEISRIPPSYEIPNLLFRDRATGEIKENETRSFNQDLDSLPFIDRSLWDRWIQNPSDYPALLLGRGCPFKCTYCSNHAMAKLATGTYVRFRSPENIIGEIEYIRSTHPDTERMYLEVETFGANRKASYAIFDALGEYNNAVEKPISFGINLALTSNYMVHHERRQELFEKVKVANITSINIGLESGSGRMRNLLKRPAYTNDELIDFCQDAKSHNIKVLFYILIGLPNETIEDYMETVRVARAAQPYNCYVSLFFPYLGTDLADTAIHMGLLEPDHMSLTSERARSLLDLPGFSKRRQRFEYMIFMWRVYKGHWPMDKIIANVTIAFFRAHPKIYSVYLFLSTNVQFIRTFTNRYNAFDRKVKAKKLPRSISTRADFSKD